MCKPMPFSKTSCHILLYSRSHDGHMINISLQTNNQILPSNLEELAEDYVLPSLNEVHQVLGLLITG